MITVHRFFSGGVEMLTARFDTERGAVEFARSWVRYPGTPGRRAYVMNGARIVADINYEAATA